MLAPARYKRLLLTLGNNPAILRELSKLTSNNELDALAKVTVALMNQFPQRILLLIKNFLEAEFVDGTGSSSAQQGSVMRGQSLASKVEGEYVRLVGATYLKELLGDLINSIVNDETLNLEIDPAKLKTNLEVRELRIAQLKQKVEAFLGRIISPDMIDKMPLEIRAISGFTAKFAGKYATKQAYRPLIGGFIMLRYLSPAIVTPESFGLLPNNAAPVVRVRRNLILIAKVLQNLSNAILFKTSAKEEYMNIFDDFLTQNFEALGSYFEAVASDPRAKASGFEPWADFQFEQLRETDIHIYEIALQDLFTLHRILDTHKPKLLPVLKAQGADLDVVNLLSELGPAPHKYKREVTLLNTDGPFLYVGPNNKQEHPVVYLIVNRIDLGKFNRIEDLLVHLLKFINDSIGPNKPLSLVIDLSWANADVLAKKFFDATREFSKLLDMVPREVRKSIREIHLVHPLIINRAVIFFMRAFTSAKFEKKIHEHSNWKTLSDFIATEKINLPDLSKMFITKAYQVLKINAAGKSQERLVKFTNRSILNVDSKSNVLSNEKLITDIDEISCIGDDELIIKFTASSVERDGAKTKLFGLRASTKADLESRKYKCLNQGDRERLVEDLFQTCFAANHQVGIPIEYKVIKVNENKKQQERTWLFTVDSVLNLDKDKIKTEMSFAAFEDVTKDPFSPKAFFIKLKTEKSGRKIICKSDAECVHIFQRLTESVAAYRKTEKAEESDLKDNVANVYREQV